LTHQLERYGSTTVELGTEIIIMKKLFAALILLLLLVGRADAAFYANYFTTNANPVAGGGWVSNVILPTITFNQNFTNGNDQLDVIIPVRVSVAAATAANLGASVRLELNRQGDASFTNISDVNVYGTLAGATNAGTLMGSIPPGWVWKVATSLASGSTASMDTNAAYATGVSLSYTSTNGASGSGGSGGVSAAQVAAIMGTNSSLSLQTTNGINYASGFAPIVQNTYAPNITFGGTNAQIVGTESHSSFVMGGRFGNGYANIVSNGQWCVINGGYGNQIIGDDDSANNSTISGGELNYMGGRWTVGGYNAFNTIAGGEIMQMGETSGVTFSINNTISGGRGNRMLGTNVTLSFIGGGGASTGENDGGNWIVNSDFSAILAGQKNRITNGPAMSVGWYQVLTNRYEIKIGYSNNSLTISSNGAVTSVGGFNGVGVGLTALNASELTQGILPASVVVGVYDQDLFFTSDNNFFNGNEIHSQDLELKSAAAPNNLPTGNNGYLLNSNKVLYWVTTTKTNLISDGR
jgi:hypothetical protein